MARANLILEAIVPKTIEMPFGRWTKGREYISIKRFAVALADMKIYFTHACTRLIANGSNNAPYCNRMLP